MRLFDFFRNKNEAADKSLKNQLLKAAKNEIRLSYSAFNSITFDACSKVGGRPVVPNDFVWPEYKGSRYCGDEPSSRPLSFMAQINLADIAEYDTENLLPKTGVLSFFYEMVTMQWGFDPLDKGCARVYYFPDVNKLSPRDIPQEMEEDAYIPELKIDFEKHISLPYPEGFDNNGFDWDEYEECCEELGYEQDNMGGVTKLLGYPDVIQNPMEEECEAVTRGYCNGSPEDIAEIPEAVKADIKNKASEWTLLFQMGTIPNGEAEIMFGDCGYIYFWIKKDDLKNKNFDNIWLILQCG